MGTIPYMGRVLLQNTGYWAWDGIEEQKNIETARAIVFCCGSFRRGMMGTARNLTIARIRWVFFMVGSFRPDQIYLGTVPKSNSTIYTG
jgi:hypothetical protein